MVYFRMIFTVVLATFLTVPLVLGQSVIEQSSSIFKQQERTPGGTRQLRPYIDLRSTMKKVEVLSARFSYKPFSINCGKLTLDDAVKQFMNNLNKFQDQVVQAAQTLLEAAPLLILTYFSPGLAAVFEHLEFIANLKIDAMLPTCQTIDAFIKNRSSEFQNKKGECMTNQVASTKMESAAKCVNDGDF